MSPSTEEPLSTPDELIPVFLSRGGPISSSGVLIAVPPSPGEPLSSRITPYSLSRPPRPKSAPPQLTAAISRSFRRSAWRPRNGSPLIQGDSVKRAPSRSNRTRLGRRRVVLLHQHALHHLNDYFTNTLSNARLTTLTNTLSIAGLATLTNVLFVARLTT